MVLKAMPQKIFLSYGHDRHAVEVLVIKADLEARGHEVWFDLERLRAGIDWDLYIEEGLRWCDKVVLAMTPHSVRRRRPQQPHTTDGFCLNEIAKAIQLNKQIVPIQLAHLEDGPPNSISRLQFIDMTDCVPIARSRARYEVRLAQLCDAIEQGPPNTEGEQARLLRYLAPLSFDSEISRHIARFAGRRWLLDALDTWLIDQPDSRVFWIIGGPGIGKTAFATHLCHSRGDVIACHFCTHGHADKTDARRAVLSLIYQLTTHLPEYARRIQDLSLEDECQKDAQTLFENLVVDQMSEFHGGEGFPASDAPRLVVIDGLDEAAGPDQRNDIALMVGRNWARTPPWLRLVITSRPEAEVVAQLQALQSLQPFVIHAESDENLDDARVFLESELGRLGIGAEAAAVDALLTLSEGNFLYLTVVLEEIVQGRMSIGSLDTFPRGMGGYYQQFFERRFPSLADYKDQFRPLLAPIVAQRGPLPLAILAHATQLSPFAVDDALQTLGSLFPVQSDGPGKEPTVTTLHKSLRDWLTGRDELTSRLTAGPYAVDIEAGESRLAEACWREYMAGSLNMSPYAMRHLLDHILASRRFNDLETILRNRDYLLARNAIVAAWPLVPRSKRVSAPDPSEAEIRRLEERLRAEPAHFETHQNLGVLYGKRRQWEKAIQHFTAASDVVPTDWRARVNLSLALAETKEFARALAAAREARQLASQPNIFLAMGLAQEGLAQQGEAAKTYSEGLQLNPASTDLALTLGNLTGRMGDFDKAIEHYKQVLKVDPTNLFASSNIAYAYEEKGERDTALQYLKRATETSPNDSIAWYDLGYGYKIAGDPAKALACFQRSFALDSKFYKSCLSIALAHDDNGELEESVEYYARAMSLTANPELWEAIARQTVRALKIPSALAPCFEPAVALEYSRFWLQLNRQRNRPGDFPGEAKMPTQIVLGALFSHYRILDQLGESPTGIVYKAEDLVSGRVVALKILPVSRTRDPDRLARFQQEVRAASSLSHPHICTLYEVGEAAGLYFIALEFVEGRSLQSELDMRSLDYRRLLRLAAQVAEGLAKAHEQGIVHRNITPETILLSQNGSAKIIDFGLAQLYQTGEAEPVSQLPNMAGTIPPTALYLSPEQAQGKDVDERSDIYSLGVVIYAMARELMPVDRRTPLDLNAIADPLPREMLAGVPDEMAALIVKATEKNPNDRYQSAIDLAADLRALDRE